MINLVESKYIGLISHRLRNFKKKTDNLYCFSCPICGDSAKNKLKARGYFFSQGSKTFYKCHNCSIGLSFPSLLKELDYNLYKDFLVDTLSKDKFLNKKEEKPLLVHDDKTKKILATITPINDLPDSHPAVLYLIKRRIPLKQWYRIYYTDDFKELVELIDPEKSENLVSEPRIVFPFFNIVHQIIAVQGRCLSKKGLRYITIKAAEQPKIFGAETISTDNPVYVTEGPIDSLFVDNCIAAAGADAKIPYRNATWIYDNEKTNKAIVKRMRKAITDGYGLFIWPWGIKSKDLNDWILEEGCTQRELQKIIEANTYKGLMAQLQMNNWLKQI